MSPQQRTLPIIEQSTITCPACGHAAAEAMPANACQFFYDCKGCGARLKPRSCFAPMDRYRARRSSKTVPVVRSPVQVFILSDAFGQNFSPAFHDLARKIHELDVQRGATPE
jgi:hypothetical protein